MVEETATTVELHGDDFVIGDAQRAAVAFPARSSGRTLDAYRHDLRCFFPWAADGELAVLAVDPSADRALSALRQRAERCDSAELPSPQSPAS